MTSALITCFFIFSGLWAHHMSGMLARPANPSCLLEETRGEFCKLQGFLQCHHSEACRFASQVPKTFTGMNRLTRMETDPLSVWLSGRRLEDM